MYNPENEKLISWIKKLMICTGFWKLPLTQNPILAKMYFVYTILMPTVLFVYWFNLICELARLIVFGYEIQLIVNNLGVAVSASIMICKTMVYLKHNILNLFEDVIRKEAEVWASGNEEIQIMYRRKIVVLKVYVGALLGTILIGVLFLEIPGGMAVLQMRNDNRLNNGTLEPHVMFQTFIPTNKLDNVKILFSTQVIWNWIGINYSCTTQLVFMALLVYAATQLQILQIRLRTYIEDDFPSDASEDENQAKILILKSLIHEHIYIIRFVTHYNDSIKYLIMLEYILSSFNLATVTVNMITSPLSEAAWLLFFFLLLAFQIFLIGWTCNEIIIQSEGVADAIFESKWYLLNKEAKQLTQIMIARAQRPLTMTIGSYGPMTTDSALTVIKAAYSYMSIMRN